MVYSDTTGYFPSLHGIMNPNMMLYGANDSRFYTVYFPSPDAPLLNAIDEVIGKGWEFLAEEVAALFDSLSSLQVDGNIQENLNVVQTIKNNELVDTPMAVYKIISGGRKIKNGIALLVFPFPTPMDDILGATQIMTGFNSVVQGVGALFNWTE